MSFKDLPNKYTCTGLKLGSGGFSTVYQGIDTTTSQVVAIKCACLENKKKARRETLREVIKQEIDIMKNMNHVNIVRFYDSFSTTNCIYIILEYCDAGTLDDVIKHNPEMRNLYVDFDQESNARYYLEQLRNALAYVRRMGYVHRDLKPSNILLTKNNPSNLLENNDLLFHADDLMSTHHDSSFNLNLNLNSEDKIAMYRRPENLLTVKLADFGLAKTYQNEKCMMTTMCGSPIYMSPELILDQSYNAKSDLWSYGVIMYQMLYDVTPVQARDPQTLAHNLRFQNISFDKRENYSQKCHHLLSSLLDKNYQTRIDWPEFLEHEWFSSSSEISESAITANNAITSPIINIATNQSSRHSAHSLVFGSTRPSGLSRMKGSFALNNHNSMALSHQNLDFKVLKYTDSEPKIILNYCE